MSRKFLLALMVLGLLLHQGVTPGQAQQDCPKPIADGIDDFVWPGGGNIGPPCVVMVTASAPETLYTLAPAPPGLHQRAAERDDANHKVSIAFVTDSGDPVVTIGLSRRHPLPVPANVAGGSQVSAAFFLPRPGIVASLTNEWVAQWVEPSGLYTLIVQRRYPGASIEEIASRLSPLVVDAPATGSGLESRGAGYPFSVADAASCVLGMLALLLGVAGLARRIRRG